MVRREGRAARKLRASFAHPSPPPEDIVIWRCCIHTRWEKSRGGSHAPLSPRWQMLDGAELWGFRVGHDGFDIRGRAPFAETKPKNLAGEVITKAPRPFLVDCL
jgi:hypothetical protein